MPWAASTLYLHDTPAARAVLGAERAFAGHVYALDLGQIELPPRVGEGWPTRWLAIRSPGRARDLPLLPTGFDWKGLDGALGARLAFARAGLAGPSSRIAPPDKPLRWMEDLAARVCGAVVWYQAEADEGAPDGEIAWVIDWGGPPVRVDEEALDRAPCVYTRKERRNLRLTPAGAMEVGREPLGAALLHLGARLDGPWFTPHRPDFAWDACRLA